MDIRVAAIEDIDGIAALYETLHHEMAAFQPMYFNPVEQDESFLRGIIEGNNSDIFVAIESEWVAAFALVTENQTPPYPAIKQHNYAYLMDMLVSPRYRGRGIGSKLIDEVKAWAKTRELDYVELNVLEENTGAKALYERHAFKNTTTMRCPL